MPPQSFVSSPFQMQPPFSASGQRQPAPWTYILRSIKTAAPDGGNAPIPKLRGAQLQIAAEPQSFFVEPIPDYSFTEKVYGDTLTVAGRILSTYQSRKNSTGVLLVGQTGAGKTLMMTILSQLARENLKIPTVVINEAFVGDDFNMFIKALPPCVIIFDEFEKVYRYGHQEALLTLYDGLFSSHKLLIHTANDINGINPHYINRPGRIYYRITFRGLDSAFVREYCEENLNNQNHVKDVIQVVSLHKSFSFDMLKALVEEMNRYNETPRSALKLLNVMPGSDLEYRVSVILPENRRLPPNSFWPQVIEGNPMVKEALRITWTDRSKSAEPSSGAIDIKPSTATLALDQSGCVYTHRTDDNITVTFERVTDGDVVDPLTALGIK